MNKLFKILFLLIGNRYDYSLVKYINSKVKVKIICKEKDHGIFEQTPNDHKRNKNCPKCSKFTRRWDTNSFIERVSKIHAHVS